MEGQHMVVVEEMKALVEMGDQDMVEILLSKQVLKKYLSYLPKSLSETINF